MIQDRKIDLALEAKELAEGSAPDHPSGRGEGPGGHRLWLSLTRVEILNREGGGRPGQAQGDLSHLRAAPAAPGAGGGSAGGPGGGRGAGSPAHPAQTGVCSGGRPGQPPGDPDAIGPRATDFLLVTRHLVQTMPQDFSALRPVSALAAGVTGTTGIESGELIGAVVKKLKPACLIAVDALAARRQEQGVCRTVQVSDTGIVPGSGVGNARMALDEEHLGIPVIAVGVPTVVEAATLCLDLLDQAGQEGFDPALFRQEGAEWFVTPRNVDSEVETLSRVLGLGISTALHVDFSVEDVEKWIS